jgi:enoyl-CoA hydratase/carnithine racemase
VVFISNTIPHTKGLIAEAGSSVSFVNKVGLGKANEILLLGRKQSAQELLRINFVQSVPSLECAWSFPETRTSHRKLFPSQPAESFHKSVREHIKQELDGLDPAALLKVHSVPQSAFVSVLTHGASCAGPLDESNYSGRDH